MANLVLGYSHSETRLLEARREQQVKKFDNTHKGRKPFPYIKEKTAFFITLL